jgi:predicted Zn-dependent protease
MRRPWCLGPALLSAGLLLSACGPAKPKTAPVVDYARLLQASEQAIAGARRELQRAPDDVAVHEEVALALAGKALLTGSYRDYAAADQALNEAFAAGDALHAPLLSRLYLDLLLHRMPRAEADRAALLKRYRVKDTAGFASESAELDFQAGRYAEALAGFHRSLNIEEGPRALARLGLWHARMGEPFEAAALFDRAEKNDHSETPYFHAWLELQHGQLLLDRGRWEQADEYFHHAGMLLPSWWLARSRQAEVLALQGERAQALALYEPLANETGDPEFMDAVARLRREGPDPASADAWIQRAAAAHAERMQLLPEAAWAHAAEHELWFGTPDAALQLAQRNATLRPNGESRLLLARALYKSGHAAEARAEVQAVAASGWNTAELHALAAQLAAALGQREESERERALALDVNLRAFRMYPLPPAAQPEALP